MVLVRHSLEVRICSRIAFSYYLLTNVTETDNFATTFVCWLMAAEPTKHRPRRPSIANLRNWEPSCMTERASSCAHLSQEKSTFVSIVFLTNGHLSVRHWAAHSCSHAVRSYLHAFPHFLVGTQGSNKFYIQFKYINYY